MTGPLAVILESTVAADCPQVEINELRANSEEIATVLEELGYEAHILPFTLDLAHTTQEFRRLNPALAFNLVDSIEGKGNLIQMAPLLMEHLGMAFTGADAAATQLTCDKLLTKRLLAAESIPTPGWLTEAQFAGDAPFSGLHILKSVTEHASFGIFADSVVPDRTHLRERLAEKRRKHPPTVWFAEEYIDGREFNLSVLAGADGPRILAPAEIVFTPEFPLNAPRIVDYAAKWYEDSAEWKGTVRRFDFPPEDASLLAELSELARRCWHLFGLTGYARVDFRVDADDAPYVLEVNSNPFLTANEGFGAAAARSGISFADALNAILADAKRRKAA
jgi:D-alanine-D-alanine ligase